MGGRELGEIRLSRNVENHGVAAPCDAQREAEARTICHTSNVDGIDNQAGVGWHAVVCNWASRRYQAESCGFVGQQLNVQVDQLAGLPGSILRSDRVGELHHSRRDSVGGSWD